MDEAKVRGLLVEREQKLRGIHPDEKRRHAVNDKRERKPCIEYVRVSTKGAGPLRARARSAARGHRAILLA
jgi:hypothetical protein